MKPTPILHVKDSSGIFGSERVILTLARNIDRDRFQLHLACMQHRDGRSRDFIEMARETGIQVIPVDANHRFEWSAISSLRRILKEGRIALVHTHDYKSDLYALIASMQLPVKRVVTSHGSTRDSWVKKLYLNIDEHLVYPKYDAVIAVSEDLGKALRNRGIRRPENIHVVQNGLDFGLLDSQKVLPDDPFASWIASLKTRQAFLIAVVGRLFPDKGHLFFLKAFERLKERHPNAKALIVGDGPEKDRLAAWIDAHHLEDRVFMCGFVSAMPAVYKAIDCLVMPSLTEGLPYTLLEALHCRVPVIATPVGDIPCLVKHEETGLLIRPADSEDIVAKLETLIHNPARTHLMAGKGEQLVENEFSAAAMARRTEELYDKLLF